MRLVLSGSFSPGAEREKPLPIKAICRKGGEKRQKAVIAKRSGGGGVAAAAAAAARGVSRTLMRIKWHNQDA